MPKEEPFSTESLGLEAIEERLNNPLQAMEAIGAVLENAAQVAFEEQEFGDFKWPPQYERAPEPWIHRAGVARDLAEGERIKTTRYGPTDPLKDSHELWGSIKSLAVSKNEVRVGSPLPYAKYHQWGSDLVGPAVQPVTSAMRGRLAKEWAKAEGGNKKALGKMFNFFKKDSIKTHIRQRPFLGITEQIEHDIRETIEMFMETGKVG